MRTLHKLASVLTLSVISMSASAGFSVDSGKLLDGKNKPFVIRGVNHSHTWFPQTTDKAIQDIANSKANTVRVVLSNGERWSYNSESEVNAIIQKSKLHKLISILEVHDTTGFGEDPSAATLESATNYWLSMKDSLIGEEDFVIINIGNEPFGNNVTTDMWVDAHISAIQRLRDNGFTHTIMVDAPNWGQDWENIMRDNASKVYNADPLKNVVFSVHMYEVYDNYSKISSYMSSFLNQGLVLVVGEFSSTHKGMDVDEASIMERSVSLDIGYIGWSWSGNDASTQDLDIALDWNPATLSDWGHTLLKSNNGIENTASVASIFEEHYPICQDPNSDHDGDGWGWENGQTCKVEKLTAPNGYPYCTSSSADPDGDGWGWEKEASCVVRGSVVDA